MVTELPTKLANGFVPSYFNPVINNHYENKCDTENTLIVVTKNLFLINHMYLIAMHLLYCRFIMHS